MKRLAVGILWAIGIYFVVRALAEPFVIDVNDPATFRYDWGGPHLAGVLLVHCGLGVIAAVLMAWRLTRRWSKRLRRLPKPPAKRSTVGRGGDVSDHAPCPADRAPAGSIGRTAAAR